MGKKLVGRDNVEQYICHEEKIITVDQAMILSPGAKDYLREKGISVVYAGQKQTASKLAQKAGEVHESELYSTIQKILQSDYAITDSEQVAVVTQQVLARLSADQ